MISPELTLKIAEWRQLALKGELSVEQCKEAIKVLRQGRAAAQASSTASRTAKAESKATIDTGALLAGLMGGKEE